MDWTAARIRRAGLAAVLGGVLWIVPYGSFGGAVPLSVAGPLAVGIPVVLLLAGVAGFRARYGRSLGFWGRGGLVVVVAGLVLFGVGGALLYQYPGITGGSFDGSISVGGWVAIALLALGSVATAGGGAALGVALHQRRVGSRAAGPLLVAQVPAFLLTDYLAAYEVPGVGRSLDLFLSMFLFGGAWVLLGYHLYATGGDPGGVGEGHQGGEGETGSESASDPGGDHPGSP